MTKLKQELIDLSYEKLYELDPSSEEYGRTLDNIKRLEGANKTKELITIALDITKVIGPLALTMYGITQVLKLEYDDGGVVRSTIGKQIISAVCKLKFW